MNSMRWLLIGVFIAGISSVGSANDTVVDEDALFGETLGGAGEDALFGEELLSETEEDGVNLAEDFLQGSKTYLLNGDMTLTTSSSRKEYQASSQTTRDKIEAAGTLTFDARPSASLRGLLKADYSIDQDVSDMTLREAIVDWTIDEQWYLRAGRQVMHWGVVIFIAQLILSIATPLMPKIRKPLVPERMP